MTLPNHLFIASDGNLYDTRRPAWHKGAPLRADYSRQFGEIETAGQFKATLRAGEFAWPGGYHMALSTADGGVICYSCAREEARNVLDSLRRGIRDSWQVNGLFNVDYCEEAIYCDHCGDELKGADQ